MITISCKILACNCIHRIYSPLINNCFPTNICSIKKLLKDINLNELIILRIKDDNALVEFLKCIHLGHRINRDALPPMFYNIATKEKQLDYINFILNKYINDYKYYQTDIDWASYYYKNPIIYFDNCYYKNIHKGLNTSFPKNKIIIVPDYAANSNNTNHKITQSKENEQQRN